MENLRTPAASMPSSCPNSDATDVNMEELTPLFGNPTKAISTVIKYGLFPVPQLTTR